MSDHYDSDPPEEIGGVPVDSDLGNLPPIDDEPVEPRIPRKAKSKTKHAPGYPGDEYTVPKQRGRRWPFIIVAGCVLLCCMCWLTCCGLLAAAGGSVAWLLDNEVSAKSTLTSPIEADDTVITLTVDNPTGRVRVREGRADEVKVEYIKKAFGFTTDQAQSGLDDMSVVLTNGDGADQFVVTMEKDDSFLHSLDHVDMTVYVPRNVHLVITTNTGAIEVEDVRVHSMDLKANTGAITFEGSFGPDDSALFNLKTNTGIVTVRLPVDAYVRLDAQTNVGGVEVSPDFQAMRVEREDIDGPDQAWLGVLGEAASEDEGAGPKLILRSNTGGVVVQVKQ